MRSIWLISTAALILSFWMTSARADFDVSPRWSGVSGAPILTYGYDDEAPPADALTLNAQQVFDFAFDDPLNPNTTTDPGFHALSTDSGFTPSGFPDATKLKFDVLSDLKFWNGSSLVAVPAGETLQLQLGPSLVTLAAGVGPQAGFTIGTVGPPSQSSEGLHVHLSSTLTGPGGADPTDGVYGFEMDLRLFNSDNTLDTAVGTSLPFFVLYDHGASDGAIDDAVAFAQTVVPEPSTCVLSTLGGLAMFGTALSNRRGARQKRHC
ncbi:MAG TPA: hypothetical protein VGI75_13040 [Pirellulales bacterium]|jgi:hypothetical protein